MDEIPLAFFHQRVMNNPVDSMNTAQCVKNIRIEDYDYPLAEECIAKFPLEERDQSRLLCYRSGSIESHRFSDLDQLLPIGSQLVYNNTKVIRARLEFYKPSGARIEVFCLEPHSPSDYLLTFQQTARCSWYCMIGNAKRWKQEPLTRTIEIGEHRVELQVSKVSITEGTTLVQFDWDGGYSFAEMIEAVGVLPIPPYLNRETQESDLERYQTVYAQIKGSVAAPTAGLHFTPRLLDRLRDKGVMTTSVTLHVGAGTFLAVKSELMEGHTMHTEFISVEREAIVAIRAAIDTIIAVGTTTVRTLESLYYLGCQAYRGEQPVHVSQWDPYQEGSQPLSARDSLTALLDYLDSHHIERLVASTQIIIAPGYSFKIVKGMITNFHQPHSTLLLLVSAFLNGDWRSVYDYALAHQYRFLSYGDSSLLLP